MKRSRVVMLTLAGVSLGVTGCRREPVAQRIHDTAILPPDSLNPAMRSSLPAFSPGGDISRQVPPHNAYDPQLGYFHAPCAGWYPYPYDHYDSRWGYYRCGKWSRYHSTQAYHSSSSYYRSGYRNGVHPLPAGAVTSAAASSLTSQPGVFTPPMDDYGRQPAGAPVHSGVQHSDASRTISSTSSRGGFGSTGRSSGYSSSSSSGS
jgi:hypothetical protein